MQRGEEVRSSAGGVRRARSTATAIFSTYLLSSSNQSILLCSARHTRLIGCLDDWSPCYCYIRYASRRIVALRQIRPLQQRITTRLALRAVDDDSDDDDGVDLRWTDCQPFLRPPRIPSALLRAIGCALSLCLATPPHPHFASPCGRRSGRPSLACLHRRCIPPLTPQGSAAEVRSPLRAVWTRSLVTDPFWRRQAHPQPRRQTHRSTAAASGYSDSCLPAPAGRFHLHLALLAPSYCSPLTSRPTNR